MIFDSRSECSFVCLSVFHNSCCFFVHPHLCPLTPQSNQQMPSICLNCVLPQLCSAHHSHLMRTMHTHRLHLVQHHFHCCLCACPDPLPSWNQLNCVLPQLCSASTVFCLNCVLPQLCSASIVFCPPQSSDERAWFIVFPWFSIVFIVHQMLIKAFSHDCFDRL